MNITRLNNDVNGNPRYAVDYHEFLTDSERWNTYLTSSDHYQLAIEKAKLIAGKKYHNKQYGGGICICTYGSVQNDVDLAVQMWTETRDYFKAEDIVNQLWSNGVIRDTIFKAATDGKMDAWRYPSLPRVRSVIEENTKGRINQNTYYIAAILALIKIQLQDDLESV